MLLTYTVQKVTGVIAISLGGLMLIGCLPFWCVGLAAAVALIIIGILVLRSC